MKKVFVLFEELEPVEDTRYAVLNKDCLSLADTDDSIVWSTARNPIRVGRIVRPLLRSAGITVIVSGTTMPLYVRTTVYLMLGWMGLLLYFQLLKKLTERKARPFIMGGIIYSLGAAFNLAHQPVIIPGLVGPHEVFHMVVIIGSLMHYYFMIKTVACYSKPLDSAFEMYDNPILIGTDASCLQEMPMSRKSA